ncbi:MAG: 4a-hydroxytetrahydrobiopterin dehydratase [Holophagales bacterium]|nr:4a-hydroxytetrahydrobiopterin dehydratase [Holophagales bacterium]
MKPERIQVSLTHPGQKMKPERIQEALQAFPGWEPAPRAGIQKRFLLPTSAAVRHLALVTIAALEDLDAELQLRISGVELTVRFWTADDGEGVARADFESLEQAWPF